MQKQKIFFGKISILFYNELGNKNNIRLYYSLDKKILEVYMQNEYHIIEKMFDGIENSVWKILNIEEKRFYILKKRCKQRIEMDPDGPKMQFNILSDMCQNMIPAVPPCEKNIFYSGQEDVLYPFVEGQSKLPRTEKMITQLVDIIKAYTSYNIKNKNMISRYNATFVYHQLDDMKKSKMKEKHSSLIAKGLKYLKDFFPEEDLEEGIVHGDLQLGNILWKEEEIIALVDWDNCMMGPKELDVAHMYVDLLLLLGDKIAETFLEKCRTELSLSDKKMYYFINYELFYALLNHYKWTKGFFGRNVKLKSEEIDTLLINMIQCGRFLDCEAAN